LISTEGRNPSQVYFTSGQMDIIRSKKGFVLSHNHPAGSSFSEADIVSAINGEFKEIRATSSKYTYDMKFKRKISHDKLERIDAKFHFVFANLYPKYNIKVFGGGMSEDEAGMEMSNEIWATIADLYPDDLEYTRMKSKKGYKDIAKGGLGSGIKGHRTEKDAKLGKIYKSLEDFEKSIVFRHHEHCLVLDENGKELFTASGDSMSISFTSEQGTMLANSKRGFLTHNHPQPSSFSFADISTASKFHLQEIRVVTPKHLYQMRFKRPISFTTKKEIAESYRILMIGAKQEYTRLLKKGVPSREISVEVSHKMWVALAKKYLNYLDYTRTERK
jgi:hypothetical protein